MPAPRRSTFAWSVLLVVLPIAVLAAVAAYALQQRRQTMRQEAETLCHAKQYLAAWETTLAETAEHSPAVRLYQTAPEPQPETEQTAALDLAIATKDLAKLEALAFNPPTTWQTTAGLPGPVVAAMQWFTLAASPAKESAEKVLQLCLNDHPSTISPILLAQIAARFPEYREEWQQRWEALELRRRALSLAAPSYAPGKTLKSELVKVADSFAIVYARTPEQARVLLATDVQAAFPRFLSQIRPQLPSWAAVHVTLQGTAVGPPLPDVLTEVEWAHGTIQSGPQDAAWLTRDHQKMIWWVVSLVGLTLATSTMGLWLIRRSLERERRLNELKSQFVSSVSHELRAPIGSMRLMADALANGTVVGGKATEFHRLMSQEGARLSSLIENVLDFARIEQNRKTYDREETDMPALIAETVKLMNPHAEAKQQSFTLDLHPLSQVPQVDAPSLQQALLNLLDNAVKFSPPGGKIHISLNEQAAENTWSLTVRDEGPGIPKAEQERVFERFYRLGNELRRETQGTGIGLSLVKHITEGHGGRVLLHSDGVGSGATFELCIPFLAKA